jgi:DNA-binding IclR family transcriptional regulator
VVCIAVPVLGCGGELLAGVAIQAPQARMGIEGGRAHLPVLRHAAGELAEIFQAVD